MAGITRENFAEVTLLTVVRAADVVGRPSRSRVTNPDGATVPSGGLPTVSVAVTEMVWPGVTEVEDGTTVRLVVLDWMLTSTGGAEAAGA